jgi:predicted secreted protein
MIATKADNGREMTASGMLRIELQQAGAAGYAWEIQDLDTAHFQVLEAGATDRSVSQKNFFGAPIGVRWVLRDKRVGSAHLRLLHYRPWEGK